MADIQVNIIVIRDSFPVFIEGSLVITSKRLDVAETQAVNSTITANPRITARDTDLLDPVITVFTYWKKLIIDWLTDFNLNKKVTQM